jgi:hypothetical protein
MENKLFPYDHFYLTILFQSIIDLTYNSNKNTNPANESLKISLANSSKAEVEILVYDFIVKRVKLLKVATEATETQISVASLPNGLYRLTVLRNSIPAYYESVVIIH